MESDRTVEEHDKEAFALVMKDPTDELKQSVRKWLLARDKTIAILEEIIALLHKTSIGVALLNMVGPSLGAVGGAIVIGSIIAAPFTLGASLIPIAIAGGVTAATAIQSSSAGLDIDSKQVDQAERCIEEDRCRLECLQKELESYKKMCRFAINIIEQSVHPESGPHMASNPDPAGPRLGYNAARMLVTEIAAGGVVAAAKTATTMANIGTVEGLQTTVMALALAHTFAAVGFGLDIAKIAFNDVELGKGTKSDIGVKLKEAVKELKDERDQFIRVP